MVTAGKLDEFQLVRLLGRGGMGEVYLGHDTVLDRAVAIKLIGARNPDARSRERFLVEARAIARLSHPNVVTIFRVGMTAEGRPFLVQELIRGRSLDRVPRPLAWRAVCELAIGIARGLEAAHRRGILHRDVKPANVMLDDTGTARLFDFGLAKLTHVTEPAAGEADAVWQLGVAETPRSPRGAEASVSETRDPDGHERGAAALTSDAASVAPAHDDSAGRTLPGAVIGTPRYTAPELWRGEPASAQSDLYSLGVMLYELLSGVLPFPQLELATLERAVVAGAPAPISELAELPAALAQIVMRCLATARAARPGSAAELVHALEAVLVDAPAVPAGNPYRGLRAFDAAHRALFFGRGVDVSALVDRLRTEPFLVVVGDSGIGKSSVCHAGVVPAVRDALGIAPARADAAAGELVRGLRPPDDEGLLIVIDQLEELVTLGAGAERVAEILAALADGVPGVKVLLAVRGDFLTRVAALPLLGGPVTRGLHLLRVLSAADLREAVVGPARVNGVRFESDAMIDTLVDAVASDPGGLPLLQFTLAELWPARDVERGLIPARALAQLGGVDGGLAGHADAVLLALGGHERAAARRIVLRLVSSSHTRAVRDRDELIGDDRVAAAALESLVSGRLVVARDTIAGTPSYELAHEALIRGWGTLRDWLDAAAGQHAARNRLIASAAEWQRLGRPVDLLWTRRQVDELDGVDQPTANERAFLAASRGVLRRRRATRIATLAAVPLAALAIWFAIRFEAARRRDREIARHAGAAAVLQRAADDRATQAAAARAAAYAAFDADRAADGEDRWPQALALGDAADHAYHAAEVELEAALIVDPGAVSAQMADLLFAHARLAEAEHDRAQVAQLVERVDLVDAARARDWQRPGRLVVELDRPARLSVHRLAEAGPTIAGRFAAAPVVSARAARLDQPLAPGSYVTVIEAPDGVVVRDPVLIGRGEQLTRRIVVPPRAAIPDDFVYVPAGRFLYGSDRDEETRQWLDAQPMHEVATAAYLIARHEVTLAQWMEYLRALPAEERAKRTPQPQGGPVMLTLANDRFTLAIRPTQELYRAVEGQPLAYAGRKIRRSVRWERLPVAGISWEDVLAYTAWLQRTGRVPGARPCTLHEWERAARGADGRTYPHGDTLRPTEANFDATYDRAQGAFGLDEVGSFPASDSPFGLSDTSGNVFELVRGPRDLPETKGGSWYQEKNVAVLANHGAAEPTEHNLQIGTRICASTAR
jgi:eukaryotic-like serine/threonine-protein kinase